jgi:hypothetical protein
MEKLLSRSCKPIQMLALFCSLVLFLLMGCEKDDICVDGDTPLLVIRFFDSTEPETPKAVSQLRVIGLGNGDPVPTFADRSNLDSIALPLRPDQTETTFVLIRDSQDEEGVETGNPDTLQLRYSTRGEFVSRACGFIAGYEGLESQLQTGSDNWIQSIEVDTTSVQNQDSKHVSIYH